MTAIFRPFVRKTEQITVIILDMLNAAAAAAMATEDPEWIVVGHCTLMLVSGVATVAAVLMCIESIRIWTTTNSRRKNPKKSEDQESKELAMATLVTQAFKTEYAEAVQQRRASSTTDMSPKSGNHRKINQSDDEDDELLPSRKLLVSTTMPSKMIKTALPVLDDLLKEKNVEAGGLRVSTTFNGMPSPKCDYQKNGNC
eukprot:PhF_6_TR37165/c0_g1_i2/m.54716